MTRGNLFGKCVLQRMYSLVSVHRLKFLLLQKQSYSLGIDINLYSHRAILITCPLLYAVWRDLDYVSIMDIIMLIHLIDSITLIRQSKQESTKIHMNPRKWKINLKKIQGYIILVKFAEVQSESRIAAFWLLYDKERVSDRIVQVLKQHIPHQEMLIGWCLRLSDCTGAWSRKKLYSSPDSGATYIIWSNRPYGIVEVSDGKRMNMEFMAHLSRKAARPYYLQSCSGFQKQLLVCYWSLIKMLCLAIGYWVTYWLIFNVKIDIGSKNESKIPILS